MSDRLAAIVLAGGLARRMGGGDKALLTLAGRPLLDHVLDRIRPQVGPVAINANGDPARFARWNLPVVADSVAGFAGPLAGVLAGMDWATGSGSPESSNARFLLSVPGDAPFLPRDLVTRLMAAAVRPDIELVVAASNGRRHPVIALWPLASRDSLRRALVEEGVRKVDRWVDRHRTAVVEWDTDPVDPFLNVNAPEDLAAAERLLADGARER